MRVCVLPTDSWAVGSYRVLQPGRELRRLGHEVFQYVDMSRMQDGPGNVPTANILPAELEKNPDYDADVYVFQRRFEYGIPTTILKLRKAGRKVVVETDDLYDGLPESSPGWKVLRENSRRLAVRAFNAGLVVADAVTVSTNALAEHYAQYNPNVHVLPNYLDWDMWADVEQQSEVERRKIRVGWMGWLAWRDRDLEILREVIPQFLARHRNVEFVSIGEPQALKPGERRVHDYLGVPAKQRRTVYGVPYRRLPEIVPTIDIGLVPLAHTQFNECKSYLKGLEYAACGIPCVATPTEPYRGFVRDGGDGLLADTVGEWLAALELLVSDDGLRREMGRAAREKASKMVIQREVVRWERTYESLLSAPSTVSTTDMSGCSSVAPVLAA